ncbi:hypothetical protein VNI00_008164 [Paramarasmius palmivorus]|uniref:Uncharacterized protein n=1 Tax=Paramarasmius palmivorus TaxID=297713 RepID=A0AAW0CZ82_9AGAR
MIVWLYLSVYTYYRLDSLNVCKSILVHPQLLLQEKEGAIMFMVLYRPSGEQVSSVVRYLERLVKEDDDFQIGA